MTAADVLMAAATLSRDDFDRMAHAIGLPSIYAIEQARGKMPPVRGPRYCRSWVPYRNHYAAGPHEQGAWQTLFVAGLASPRPPREGYPQQVWSLTPAGIAVVRTRIEAEVRAAGAARGAR